MAREELVRFIEAAREKGYDERLLMDLLEDAGWPRKEVLAALSHNVERNTGLVVPVRRVTGEGARDAFLHLLAFGTLIAWITSAGSLIFTAIERAIPDPTMYSPPPGLEAHQMASLLVTFPVYLLTQRALHRDMRAAPEKAHSEIRRWLTWLALLAAASVMIGDLIAVIGYMLRGELTSRFVAKAVTVLLLAGGVFVFYLRSLAAGVPSRQWSTVAAGAASLVALTALAAGFSAIGSPESQRMLEADRRRVEAIRQLTHELRTLPELPESLAASNMRGLDPISGMNFDYHKTGLTTYEICALFEAASAEQQQRYRTGALDR
ncbi:MAG TPA: DUF5671 domain-containing protein, partial [Bryobacteraceae bacterium]|nr:DUF5671 domain-containing protein [Bryobacteraceae bacterium]